MPWQKKFLQPKPKPKFRMITERLQQQHAQQQIYSKMVPLCCLFQAYKNKNLKVYGTDIVLFKSKICEKKESVFKILSHR